MVQEQLESFLAQVEAETGSGLPDFIKAEVDAFLECGILAHGFLRLRCADCGHEKLVAFSCKKRGFCPSCGARRMAEKARHRGSYERQPKAGRARRVACFARQGRIVHRVIATFSIKRAGLKRAEAATGAVTLIQRFGSAASYDKASHAVSVSFPATLKVQVVCADLRRSAFARQ